MPFIRKHPSLVARVLSKRGGNYEYWYYLCEESLYPSGTLFELLRDRSKNLIKEII